MRMHILCIGNRMPKWVDEAVAEFTVRMPRECSVSVQALPVARRGKNAAIKRLREQEADALRSHIPRGALVVALDERGKSWSTLDLSERMQGWLHEGRDIALLIGGPDGLDANLRQQADLRWSLSPLTFPHGLARVVLAEQLYRAWSVLKGHPYHRGN